MSKRRKSKGISLGGTWGSGRDNALTSGWGGKSKRGGGGLVPRAWGGKSKRTRLLTPAVWERPRGSKRTGSTFAKSFGLKARRGQAKQSLDMGFTKRKHKGNTLLGALDKGTGRKRKNGGGLVAAMLGPKGRRGKRKRIKGLARVIARSLMAGQNLSSSIDVTDEMIMRQRQMDAGIAELMSDKEGTMRDDTLEAVRAAATAESASNPLAALWARLTGVRDPDIVAARDQQVQTALAEVSPTMQISQAQINRLATGEDRQTGDSPLRELIYRVQANMRRGRR